MVIISLFSFQKLAETLSDCNLQHLEGLGLQMMSDILYPLHRVSEVETDPNIIINFFFSLIFNSMTCQNKFPVYSVQLAHNDFLIQTNLFPFTPK